MAMNSVELFLAGEEDDFGFELFPVEIEDIALSQWELVDPSDDESSDRCCDPGADLESPTAGAAEGAIAFPDEMSVDAAGSPAPNFDHLMLAMAQYYGQLWDQGSSGGGADVGGEDCEEEEDEEEEGEGDEDDDGLDDELVPRHLKGKLGRQRMRKLGKRACSKMNTSKRSPHLYVKSGCLYGKHGLGLKHSLC